MELYQSGDYAAFETLYTRHAPRVLGYFRKKAPAHSASELFQEAFLKLHRGRTKFSAGYPFLPWLFSICRHVLFDYLRRNETQVAAHASSDALSSLPALAKEDIGDGLRVALSGLPEPQRRAIELRYLSEWSFERIATNLNTTPLNVRQLISRGLKKARSSTPEGSP